jgi:flagellar biosynthesis protein
MKKTHEKAVALRYRKATDRAPRIIAKGEGLIAKNIKKIALEHGVPIHRDDTLVELLSEIEIDREIPQELYTAIAELLSWIYRANKDLHKELSDT